MAGNRNRGSGGTNSRVEYQCFICGASFTSYPQQKKHISRAHGKSTKGYDKILENEDGKYW